MAAATAMASITVRPDHSMLRDAPQQPHMQRRIMAAEPRCSVRGRGDAVSALRFMCTMCTACLTCVRT
jgi:hypothetical protein